MEKIKNGDLVTVAIPGRPKQLAVVVDAESVGRVAVVSFYDDLHKGKYAPEPISDLFIAEIVGNINLANVLSRAVVNAVNPNKVAAPSALHLANIGDMRYMNFCVKPDGTKIASIDIYPSDPKGVCAYFFPEDSYERITDLSDSVYFALQYTLTPVNKKGVESVLTVSLAARGDEVLARGKDEIVHDLFSAESYDFTAGLSYRRENAAAAFGISGREEIDLTNFFYELQKEAMKRYGKNELPRGLVVSESECKVEVPKKNAKGEEK